MLVYNKHLLLILFLRTCVGLHPVIRPTSSRLDFSASSFYRIRDLAECQNPVTLVDLGIFLRVYSLSCMAPTIASRTRFSPLHDLVVKFTSPGGHDEDNHPSDLAGVHGFLRFC